MYIASINVSNNKESYNAIKGNLGTFEQLSSSTSPVADVGRVSLKEVASLITPKEDRVENTKLKRGLIRQKGGYIGRAVDFGMGIFTSLSLPESTAAHGLADKDQSI